MGVNLRFLSPSDQPYAFKLSGTVNLAAFGANVRRVCSANVKRVTVELKPKILRPAVALGLAMLVGDRLLARFSRKPFSIRRRTTDMLAKAVEVSSNRKLGPVSATFVSQVSCPDYCPWYDDGKWGSPC